MKNKSLDEYDELIEEFRVLRNYTILAVLVSSGITLTIFLLAS